MNNMMLEFDIVERLVIIDLISTVPLFYHVFSYLNIIIF